MYQRFLSWRTMHARRTNLIGIFGILIGVGALILINSIMAGFLEQSRQTVRGSLSDLMITPYDLSTEGFAPARDPAPLLEVVRADPRVEAAAARTTWYGLIVQSGGDAVFNQLVFASPDNRLAGAQLIGVDARDELAATDLRAALERPSLYGLPSVEDVEDPFARPSDYRGSAPWSWVVVGDQLAKSHFLRRGSEINLATWTVDPATDAVDQCNRKFLVAGVFRTGENDADLARIYMDRRELVDLLGTERTYTQVVVKARDYAASEQVERRRPDGTVTTRTVSQGRALQHDLFEALSAAGLVHPDYPGQIETWEDQRQHLLGAIENEKVLLGIMLSLVLIVAGFTVFAILSMLVTEKRRDIGILTALGAPPRGILGTYLLIGLWDALIGSGLGALLGLLGARYINEIERWLSSTIGYEIFDRSVYYFDHIPTVVEPTSVALIIAGAFLSSLLFATVPAWRAGRLHPIDALRYE